MEELRKEATEKVEMLLKSKFYTKTALAKKIDISLSSLYNRLRSDEWTGDEINIIMEL